MAYIIYKLLILTTTLLRVNTSDYCPNKCTCKRSTQREAMDWVKVRCGDSEKLSSLEEDDFLNIANELIQLNLSYNHLTVFTPKVQFPELQKLDLSNNQLTKLQENQFIELPKLRRLDLSGNSIKHIDESSLSNLKHLERLKLNQNYITTIEKGTFNNLHFLKQLDISGNPLKCDCSLLWLLEWADKMSIKLLSNPKCETPQTFAGKPLRKLKVGVEIHCKSPAKNRDMPVIELIPDNSQVVFEGDSLKLQCRAPSISDNFETFDSELKDRIEWQWLDSNPRHHFNNIDIKIRYLADSGLIDSSLVITQLHRNHSGIWNCQLITQQGNHSKSITIVVISDQTRYCQVNTTVNNKGVYVWPRTVVNYTVSLPCESIQLTSEIHEQRAFHFCSFNGLWQSLNTSRCSFISETTKILEQFSKVNLTLVKGSILESAKHFKNYTLDTKIMKDVMDLVFAARTIDNYLRYLLTEPELGTILFEIVNNFLELDDSYLLNANIEDNSCTKILKAIEKLSNFTPKSILNNVVLDEFSVKGESFDGMTCTWYINSSNRSDRLFNCVSYTSAVSFSSHEDDIKASIQIPPSLFYQLQEMNIKFQTTSSLLVAMFSNSKLFPHNLERNDEHVTSSVVGVKIDNITVTNLTEPIYIMLKPIFQHGPDVNPPTPVWWNASLNNGQGGWSSEGCDLSHEVKDNMVFSCKHLGYYGLMQDASRIVYIQPGAIFRFSHPAIYVGTFILFLCLFLSILSYLFSYSVIQMPKKTKHSLINTWLAISLLCFMYVFGIYQTEDTQICQIVGLSLHYFTLSSLLWMCVGVNTMYKRLRKSDSIELQDDELPSDEPIQKPILGLYLVGWGIALIVCGISGAVNIKEYAAYSHCFLNSAPALSALYIPFIILIVFLIIFFLLIRCAIYSTDSNGHLSEGTQATENVDLDLLEPNFPHVDTHSIRSVSSKTASSEIEDPEHAPMAQLKAYIIFLFIYVFAWICCALATIKPLKILPFEEDVFSIMYAVLASLLGLFTLFFYCIARNDIRTQWVLTSQMIKRKGLCFRSRNVSDTDQNIAQIQPLPSVPNQVLSEVFLGSRSSSRSSAQTKSVSHNSNVLKAAADLNGSTLKERTGTKINNVNLVVLHRQQYRNSTVVPNLIENQTQSAEMFYNPHQSTVARKFFKKQKRHMMKCNNLGTRRTDLNSETNSVVSYPRPKHKKENSSIDTSIFGTNSKVNNKNIHVENVHKNKIKHPNLNILSDSCEDLSSINIPVGKLIMSHRKKDFSNKIRSKKKQNVGGFKSPENNMRSVSQQCTLEYSSETISDSILDQKSPEKMLPIQNSFDTEISEAVPSTRRENSPMESLSKIHESYRAPKTNNVDTFYNKNIYEPSEIIDTHSEFSEARIYVNPSHDMFLPKRAQSRGSSVSASELDELYQQIKRGPKLGAYPLRRSSPCLSDSEISTYLCVNKQKSFVRKKKKFDKDETTV